MENSKSHSVNCMREVSSILLQGASGSQTLDIFTELYEQYKYFKISQRAPEDLFTQTVLASKRNYLSPCFNFSPLLQLWGLAILTNIGFL